MYRCLKDGKMKQPNEMYHSVEKDLCPVAVDTARERITNMKDP